ncbi:D-alanyl-D-alanine carboxypeptidase [Permianibacter sp. IMCC34836]|uniref:D-alanyl-D-alanine carboxypeptidase family protein n=1 Tax=Permianibacter fluminis TaxID=2738515 RepID=UPI0015540C70|nr:serine hydrolase [Permianibacter fluminis]NQD36181.1 D-alanyl-D-alanine carboxypeptidase [Permianibacter fluminis]
MLASSTLGAAELATTTVGAGTDTADTTDTVNTIKQNLSGPESTANPDRFAGLHNTYPQVAKAYYVQLNQRALWGQAIDERLPPASLTKLLTAHVILNTLELDRTLIVSAHAASMTGTRLGLRRGDHSSVRDLLIGMLLGSGNDACVALAEAAAGSESAFVAQMNTEASKLGLQQSHFANPCGFDAADHYSSVRDLVTLTETALTHPELAQWVRQSEASIRINDKPKTIKSSNALLGRLPGAIGVKTGFTQRAGKCVIALVERDGQRVLAVFLNAPDRWWDLAAIIELAFRHARSEAAR